MSYSVRKTLKLKTVRWSLENAPIFCVWNFQNLRYYILKVVLCKLTGAREKTSLYTRNKSFAVFISARQKKRSRTDGRTHPLIESWLKTNNLSFGKRIVIKSSLALPCLEIAWSRIVKVTLRGKYYDTFLVKFPHNWKQDFSMREFYILSKHL